MEDRTRVQEHFSHPRIIQLENDQGGQCHREVNVVAPVEFFVNQLALVFHCASVVHCGIVRSVKCMGCLTIEKPEYAAGLTVEF